MPERYQAVACSECGSEIQRRLDKRNINHFCNSSCAATYNNRVNPKRRVRVTLTCPVCNKDFIRDKWAVDRNTKLDRQNVCSHNCARWAKLGYVPDQRFCKNCGVKIIHKYRYCSDCRLVNTQKILSYTVGQIKELYKDKNLMAVAAKIRGYGKTIYENSDKPKYCVVCGYSKHYEVCHIEAVSSFSDDATMAQVHALDNLVALCPNCHWEFDHGLLELN